MSGSSVHDLGSGQDAYMARIGVDGFNLAMPRGTGVATYARVLTHALHSLGHSVDVLYGAKVSDAAVDLLREVQFFDALDREGGRPKPTIGTPRWCKEVSLWVTGVRAGVIPVTGQVVVRGFESRMPSFSRILNASDLFGMAERHFKRWGRFLRVRVPGPVPDIMHWTYPLPITLEGARNIYTLHDLVPLRLPYTTLDEKRMYLRLIQGCLRWGDHICTVSESSRRDIIEMLGAAPDQVTNTYQSSQMAVPPIQAAGAAGLASWLNGLFGLPAGGYFLFFGALEPKKNVGRIIEAYLASGVTMPLVIVGGRSWKAEGELRLLLSKPANRAHAEAVGRVQMLDYVSSSWLAGLIRGARAVLFPSLYEGFGLPVLEAMQVGTPVLTSTESSLPEVAGEMAVLVNPYDTNAIAQALTRLAGDDELHARLSRGGVIQAELFDLSHYQTKLAGLYGAVLKERRTNVHFGGDLF